MQGEVETGYLTAHVEAIHRHLAALAGALPTLPDEFRRVAVQLEREWQTRGPGTVLALLAGFIFLGFAVEFLYRRLVPAFQVQDTSVSERVRSMALRFAVDLAGVAAFALGSTAVFLAFDWPARFRHAVVGLLAAFIAVRLVLVIARALLSPQDARLRILPISDEAGRSAQRRLMLFAGWLAFGWALVDWLSGLGISPPARSIVAYVLGIGLLAIGIEATWRHSRTAALCLALAWLFWVARAWGFFWLALVVVALPPVLRSIQTGVDHALRPPGTDAPAIRSVLAAALGRGLRALAIIGAAFLLIDAFGLDVDTFASADTVWIRLLRGSVHALAIILVADLLWMVSAALIDQKLAASGSEPLGPSATEEQHRQARLRTLLPIVRGTLAAVLLVMAALMSLSALGVQVAPLIAGAGVVGVAIGFGSQTLVRDLLSKFFYLLDDAFRVGEYIQSGNYKGTVEHLGVRSVRLRHHRGPLYTIPYGQLGAVQNSSRDWVIDKMTLGLVYGTDLDKVKKLLKQIGKELSANPEFAPDILEPLKMQGVDQFGDFAIQVRLKMKTLPNKQFTIRRRAYAMIQKVFAENNIQFAFPTVQVAGQGDVSAAVAKQALDIAKSA